MSMSPATTAAALPPNAAVAAKATCPLAGPTMSGRQQATRRVEAEVADDLERAPACGELRSRGRSGSGARERRFCGRAEVRAACSFAARACVCKRPRARFRRVAAVPVAPAITESEE